MKKEYTIKEFSDRLSVSTRTIERYLKSLYRKENNKIIIPLDVVELLEVRHNHDTTTTELRQNSDNENEAKEFDIIEGFSDQEYQEFQKRLIEHPILLKELNYHKKSAESHQKQMEKVLSIMQERNLLEAAKDPNFIKS